MSAAKDKAVALLRELLDPENDNQFYSSAIELGHNYDGELFEKRARVVIDELDEEEAQS